MLDLTASVLNRHQHTIGCPPTCRDRHEHRRPCPVGCAQADRETRVKLPCDVCGTVGPVGEDGVCGACRAATTATRLGINGPKWRPRLDAAVKQLRSEGRHPEQRGVPRRRSA